MASVKERIERQVVASLAQGLAASFGLDPANVQRFDPPNNRPLEQTAGLPNALVIVTAGEADAVADGENPTAVETFVVPLTIDAHLIDLPANTTLAEQGNAWLAELHRIVMADPQRLEDGSGERLAIDTRVAGFFSPTAEDEQRDVLVGVIAEVTYRHAEGRPDTLV